MAESKAKAGKAEAATVNMRGLKCPLPVLKTRKLLSKMAPGEVLVIECTDPLTTPEEERLTASLARLESGYQATLVFETDGSQVGSHLRQKWPVAAGSRYHNPFSPAFVVGSSLERELAQELGTPHLSVSFPVANRAVLDRGYTGFSGGLRLTEDLLGAIVVNR